MRRSPAATLRFPLLPTLVVLVALLAGNVPACAMTPVAPATTLSPQEARGDRERLWANGCIAVESRTTPATLRDPLGAALDRALD